MASPVSQGFNPNISNNNSIPSDSVGAGGSAGYSSSENQIGSEGASGKLSDAYLPPAETSFLDAVMESVGKTLGGILGGTWGCSSSTDNIDSISQFPEGDAGVPNCDDSKIPSQLEGLPKYDCQVETMAETGNWPCDGPLSCVEFTEGQAIYSYLLPAKGLESSASGVSFYYKCEEQHIDFSNQNPTTKFFAQPPVGFQQVYAWLTDSQGKPVYSCQSQSIKIDPK